MIKLVDLYLGGLRREGLEFLYELMREREPEVNISHREFPSFEHHRAFVERRPYRFWYLISTFTGTVIDTEPPVLPSIWVGYISATHNNEIGIVVRKQFRGHGFGPAAIRALIELHKPNPAMPSVRNGNWLANISPANEHSRHVFKRIGFRKIQETFEFQKSNEESHGNQKSKAG